MSEKNQEFYFGHFRWDIRKVRRGLERQIVVRGVVLFLEKERTGDTSGAQHEVLCWEFFRRYVVVATHTCNSVFLFAVRHPVVQLVVWYEVFWLHTFSGCMLPNGNSNGYFLKNFSRVATLEQLAVYNQLSDRHVTQNIKRTDQCRVTHLRLVCQLLLFVWFSLKLSKRANEKSEMQHGRGSVLDAWPEGAPNLRFPEHYRLVVCHFGPGHLSGS